jgi:hypothetical protein
VTSLFVIAVEPSYLTAFFIYFKEMEYQDVYWIDLARYVVQWLALVNKLMARRVP